MFLMDWFVWSSITQRPLNRAKHLHGFQWHFDYMLIAMEANSFINTFV
jgi:hypothetical protein